MISSLQADRPVLTLMNWVTFPNNWLHSHGYPQHTASQREVISVLGNAASIVLSATQLAVQASGQPGLPEPPQGFEPDADSFGGIFSKKMSPKIKSPNKLYNIPFYDAFRHRFSGTRHKGEIGLEIEAEGMNLFNTPVSYWVCRPDGSLRTVKDHPPVEYVLREPISREEVPKALAYLTKKLRESGSSIVESHRTSVHVHVNCQELTIKQIYQFWCMYTIFEEMLVDFSGPDRPGNLFCLSTKQAEYAVNCLEAAIQNENFNDVFNDNIRYTSCNMASLGKFGSMEFRSMRGTVDQNLIQVWVDLILLLRDEALKYECPRSIVEDYTRLGPDAFLYKTFSTRPDIRGIFLSRPLAERNKSMWEGLRLMKDVAYAITWDKRIPEDKKKESTKESLSQDDIIYEGYLDYLPVELIHPDGVWLMENPDGLRVVNFADHGVTTSWRHHTSCAFSPRRYWGVNGNYAFNLHSDTIEVSAYAPEM